jgi:hypothetical protein
MRLVSVKNLKIDSEKNRVVQCRKDTENMRYYQEGRTFGQHQPPSRAHILQVGRPIRPYRWFLDLRKVASFTFVFHTKFATLNVQY